MNHNSLIARRMILSLGVIIFAACTPAAPALTSAPPTAMPAPPTATLAPPTATLVPPATTQPPIIQTIFPASNKTSTPPAPVSTEQNSSMPSPRGSASTAYDSKINQILLFGGGTGSSCWNDCPPMNGETWIYDVASKTWTQIKPPTSPSGRANAAMAYDAESDRIILSAGFITAQNYAPSDVWAFDMNTKTWTQMKPQSPPYSFGHKMVYDSKADRMIVWGGWNFDKNVGPDDTWTYDYNTDTWTKLNPKVRPQAVNLQGMAYDSKADRVIMWGGGFNTSVWVYDLNKDNWEERKPTGGPSSRFLHAMSYDPVTDRVILYGGYTGDPMKAFDFPNYTSSETWAYDYNTNTWTQLNPSQNPGPLTQFSQEYISSIGRLFLFGGEDNYDKVTNKTWLYDPSTNTWTEVTPKP